MFFPVITFVVCLKNKLNNRGHFLKKEKPKMYGCKKN